jgi:hypothetical protein
MMESLGHQLNGHVQKLHGPIRSKLSVDMKQTLVGKDTRQGADVPRRDA